VPLENLTRLFGPIKHLPARLVEKRPKSDRFFCHVESRANKSTSVGRLIFQLHRAAIVASVVKSKSRTCQSRTCHPHSPSRSRSVDDYGRQDPHESLSLDIYETELASFGLIRQRNALWNIFITRLCILRARIHVYPILLHKRRVIFTVISYDYVRHLSLSFLVLVRFAVILARESAREHSEWQHSVIKARLFPRHQESTSNPRKYSRADCR